MQILRSRRTVLAGIIAAGGAGLFNTPWANAAGEPPPETTTVRLPKFFPSGCEAPQYIATELLHAEGITDLQYIEGDTSIDTSVWIARGELDFDWNYAAMNIASIDAGVPIKILTGMHSGCLELIANDSIRTVADLKGKRVGVFALSSSPHILVTLMAAYVGLDPVEDIEWIIDPKETSMELFIKGKIDAFLAVPPEPQALRAQKIGHTILSTTIDAPWSQYYCCMLAGTTDYVSKYPIATKRVMRALLKAVDLCMSDPQAVAKQLIDRGFASQYDFTLQSVSEVRYDRWREFDPEDTLRFYALRLQEVGHIKHSPNKIINEGTDWRFLNELKRELKS